MRLKEITISANTGLDAIKRAPIVDEYTGLKCLRIQDMSQNKEYDDWGNTQTTENDYKKFKLRIDDVLVARTGATVGVSYLVRKNLNAVFNNGSIRLRLSDNVDARFVYYVFQTKSFKQYIDNVSCVATQPNLRVETLLKFNIPDYDINIQRRIASILFAYDKLIENNNRRIRLLERMVENLYKEWFVRFRFHGHDKVEFEDGLPKGWEIMRFKDVIIEQPKSKVQVGNVEGNSGQYPFYTSGANILQYNQYLVDGENILLNTGGIADVKYSIGKIHYSTDTWCIKGIDGYTLFLYLYLKGILPEINASYFEGAALKHLKKASFKKKKLLVPPTTLIKEFNLRVSVFYREIFWLKQNTQLLSRQRDLLLPRLMSGKLEVNA